MTTLDLTKGLYRKVYQCWLDGRRINSVSTGAALAFLHFMLLADDFGNLTGDADSLRFKAFPRRKPTEANVRGWINELTNTTNAKGDAAPLLVRYAVAGEEYLHVAGFVALQPCGRNGRRIRRVPPYPEEVGESGKILGDPEKSGRYQDGNGDGDHDQNHDGNHGHTEHKPPEALEPCASPVSARPPEARRAINAMLTRIGVDGPALDLITEHPDATPERVHALWLSIKASGKARDVKRVFVSEYCRELGITLPKKSLSLAGDLQGQVAALNSLRTNAYRRGQQ